MENDTFIKPPAIILAKPQMGANIGASARAMANFGLQDLSLISPRDGWPNESATANAVGALDILNPVQIFDDTATAIKPYTTLYATTARPRDMRKKVFNIKQAIEDIQTRHQNGEQCAILFGGERAGLDNNDISRAHHIITVPNNPEFSSINLGQSVLLVAYEWFQQTQTDQAPALPDGGSPPADQATINDLMERLESELDIHNFFRNPSMRPTMMRNIRTLFARAEMSEQETQTLHGIISALIGNKIKNK